MSCPVGAYIFVPATPWVPADDLERVRETLAAGSLPDMLAAPMLDGMQTCDVPAHGEADGSVCTLRTLDGSGFSPARALGVTMAHSKQLVRFGYTIPTAICSRPHRRLALDDARSPQGPDAADRGFRIPPLKAFATGDVGR